VAGCGDVGGDSLAQVLNKRGQGPIIAIDGSTKIALSPTWSAPASSDSAGH